ncbi:UPF0187 protein [Smittium mucronatum]|uniref:UPF0187 protein n=1 Tax=Smittium mucronatum TaxID=133383 RepID=A0A1R0H5Z1_9FUNG|nr:UPF0187 protein [Smittium mucronatum]
MIISVIYSVLVWLLMRNNKGVALPGSTSGYFSTVVSLLLVFRTNTAYDRFWEGRKLYSNIERSITEAIRVFHVAIPTKTEHDVKDKIQAMKNAVAMSYSIKYYLLARPNYLNKRMAELLPPRLKILYDDSACEHSIDEKIPPASDFEMRHRGIFTNDSFNLPIALSFEITNYLQSIDKSEISPVLFVVLFNLVSSIMDAFVGCIRIQTTPVPFAYSSHLHLVCAVYLMYIPFTLNGYHIAVITVIQLITTFMLLGILSIAEEIENPFGCDKNDLPISNYCDNLYDQLMYILETHPPQIFP